MAAAQPAPARRTGRPGPGEPGGPAPPPPGSIRVLSDDATLVYDGRAYRLTQRRQIENVGSEPSGCRRIRCRSGSICRPLSRPRRGGGRRPTATPGSTGRSGPSGFGPNGTAGPSFRGRRRIRDQVIGSGWIGGSATNRTNRRREKQWAMVR
jgi:hypothetical protein